MKIILRNSFIIVFILLQSCATASIQPAQAPIATTIPMVPTATSLPPTQAASPTLDNVELVFATPVSTAIPDPIRRTPLTLMLHRRNYRFDSVQFLKDLIPVLKQNEMQVVTYRALVKQPDLTLTQQGKLFIITIDDIYLRYPIDPSVLEMIRVLVDAGYPAVLGVITESDYAYPETVDTLRNLQNIGWEIASHSDTHRNLAEVEKIAPKSIYPEIKASLDKLEKALTTRPITLISPEGQMTRGDEQIKRSKVLWIIGINGGTEYDTRDPYYYLGREGPDGTAEATFGIMQKRFNP